MFSDFKSEVCESSDEFSEFGLEFSLQAIKPIIASKGMIRFKFTLMFFELAPTFRLLLVADSNLRYFGLPLSQIFDLDFKFRE